MFDLDFAEIGRRHRDSELGRAIVKERRNALLKGVRERNVKDQARLDFLAAGLQTQRKHEAELWERAERGEGLGEAYATLAASLRGDSDNNMQEDA